MIRYQIVFNEKLLHIKHSNIFPHIESNETGW